MAPLLAIYHGELIKAHLIAATEKNMSRENKLKTVNLFDKNSFSKS